MATCNPSELISEATCFQCLSNKELKAVIAQLLCNISQGGGASCDDRIVITSGTIGTFHFEDSNSVISISFPNATALDNLALYLNNLASLVSFSAPLLQSATDDSSSGTSISINITGCPALTSINLSSLSTTTGAIIIEVDPLLTSISFPSLVSIGFSLFLDNNAGLVTVSCPQLTSTASDIVFQNDPSLTTISMPSLVTVGGNLTIECDVLTNLDLSSLQTAGAGIGVFIDSCPLLTSISLPNLTTVSGPNLNISANPLLTSFSAPNLVYVNVTNYSWNQDALDQASVDGILARANASGMAGGGTIDLSAGSNSPPTGGVLNPDYVALIGNGVTVLINP